MSSSDTIIAFNDGAAYERMMGKWSQLVGAHFLDWLAPRAGLSWVDVGCGNGAFTEMIAERCAPSAIEAIDPSEGQLTFARTRPGTGAARFHLGDAMALPLPDQSFDAAVMALVIFFVPEPAKGIAEMARVVRPGGSISAYAWDASRGGFPYGALWEEMDSLGMPPARPPSIDASRLENLSVLWADAGLAEIETKEIVVARSFADFDAYWSIILATNAGAQIAKLDEARQATLRTRLQRRLPTDRAGRISYTARANAIKGRRPL